MIFKIQLYLLEIQIDRNRNKNNLSRNKNSPNRYYFHGLWNCLAFVCDCGSEIVIGTVCDLFDEMTF